MNISKLAPAEAIEAVTAMETVEQLREAATSINVTFSGNTGEATLRKKLMDTLKSDLNELEVDETVPDAEKEEVPDFGGEDTTEDEIQSTAGPAKTGPTMEEILNMDPNQITDPQLLRQVVRAKALRLHRVKITNLDPSDSQLNGAIITAINKFTGKVAKYIPFGDEEAPNGYHVPEILLNQLKNTKFPLRREIKGGAFGVKRYKTTMINKFNIETLPPLTEEEIEELANHQRASHAIDN
jgi:hypothetical protein